MEQSHPHFQELERLLALERREEERRTREALADKSLRQLQSDGLALIGLVVEETSYSGAEERIDVTLKRADAQDLPFHTMRVGSRLALTEKVADGWSKPVMGTLLELGRNQLRIALDREPEDDLLQGSLAVAMTADDVSLRRMEEALGRISTVREGRLKELRRVIVLGERAGDIDPHLGKVASFFDERLNDSQRQAVLHALASRDVALVHGPPGTGKTRTVVEIIRQTVAREERVLATAPANIAVDNMLERLGETGLRVVRLGHPARVRAHLRAFTYDEQVNAAMDPAVQRQMRAEERALVSKLQRAREGRHELRLELRALRKDLRRLHRDARRQVLADAQVVLATCTGAGDPVLAGQTFNLAVIDEAAQCVEPLAYLPLLASARLVMAGDHLQLSPTVLSLEAERGGLGRSLFQRLAEAGDPSSPAHPARMLTVQYRMHHHLMDFLSRELYGGRLQADPSVATHHIEGLLPFQFIDTAGASFDEERPGESLSCENSGEARLLVEHLRERVLGEAGISPGDVAVIAPYSAQVQLLRRELPIEGLEIDSVDGFQGREKDVVLVSLVRSNPSGEIGFLSDLRRMNVALSRARRHLWVIGDSATLARNRFYASLIAHAESAGGYDSAWSYI